MPDPAPPEPTCASWPGPKSRRSRLAARLRSLVPSRPAEPPPKQSHRLVDGVPRSAVLCIVPSRPMLAPGTALNDVDVTAGDVLSATALLRSIAECQYAYHARQARSGGAALEESEAEAQAEAQIEALKEELRRRLALWRAAGAAAWNDKELKELNHCEMVGRPAGLWPADAEGDTGEMVEGKKGKGKEEDKKGTGG